MKECQRCGRETNTHTMSMFNTELICLHCKRAERRLPEYNKARDREHQEVMKGNYNYEGIGYPYKK